MSNTIEMDVKYNLIEQILVLQESCSKYVIPQTRQNMFQLLKQGLVFSIKSPDGKILATAYKQPLDKTLDINHINQVFKFSGLSLLKSKKVSRKKELYKLLYDLADHLRNNNFTMINSTINPVIAKFMIHNMECVELTYSECKENFPRLLQLYMEGTYADIPAETDCKDKKFYVRVKT